MRQQVVCEAEDAVAAGDVTLAGTLVMAWLGRPSRVLQAALKHTLAAVMHKLDCGTWLVNGCVTQRTTRPHTEA